MKRQRPSALIDRIGHAATRRSTLRLLSVGAFSGIAGASRLLEAGARRKKHKRCPAKISAGPPVVATITFQDRDGLEAIVVTKSENADTVVPSFSPGTTEPVVVTSTEIDATQAARVQISVTDSAGHAKTCRLKF